MWAILQHVDWEGPGLIAEALRARKLGYQIHRLDRGGAAPALEALRGLVVMGGTMGVYEADRLPFLRQEMELIAACMRAGKPVLGVCLGAQLLAAALGAEVSKGPVLEIGAGEVRLTPAGQADPVLGGQGASLPVVHWHQDTFPLPAGAALLASTDLYAQQAFRAGRLAYGLQFHVEVDAALAAAWAGHGLALAAPDVARVEAAGRAILARFFALAA